MVHTVGISGVNGNLGAPTAKALVKAAEEDKIKLVIFHRDGSKPKDITPGPSVELRILDFGDSEDKIEAAVKGINVFISNVSMAALANEQKVVNVLAKSPDLVTFIPSTYSTTWQAEDFKDPNMGPILSAVHQGWDTAKEKGLGVTAVYTGVFDIFFFKYGFLGSPLKENVVQATQKQMQTGIPISTLDHLGSAIAEIASRDPETIKGREYSVVSFWVTGQDLVDVYTKINGQQPKIKDFTQSDREAQLADAENFGPVVVGYRDKWENASFKYDTDGKIVENNYRGPSLEQVARSYL